MSSRVFVVYSPWKQISERLNPGSSRHLHFNHAVTCDFADDPYTLVLQMNKAIKSVSYFLQGLVDKLAGDATFSHR